MSHKKKKTSDAVTILHDRFIKGDQKRLDAIEAERERIQIAQQIYAMRQERGLTQKQLAEIMGTTQSVISRLEDTDYESERLETLHKIATALNCRLEVKFVSKVQSTSDINSKGEQVSAPYIWSAGEPLHEAYNWDHQERSNYKFQQCG